MLLEGGHQVTLIGIENSKDVSGNYPRFRFILYPFSFVRKSKYSVINRWVAWGRQRMLHIIWRLLKPDIVHVHQIDLRAYDCVRANIHPLVLTAWGSDVNDLLVPGKVSKARGGQLVEAIASADYITADTIVILKICEMLAGHIKKSALLYFGIDFDRFKPGYVEEANRLRKEYGISSDKKVILSARILKPKYGHQLILDAFAQLLSDSKFSNTCLILKKRFIEPFEYEDQLRAHVDQLGIADHVVWIDSVPNEIMPALYAMSDVVVNYPDMDGFPVTFLETAACNRPMISCELPAYEGIFPEDTFWMVPPNDAHELYNAFKVALSADAEEIRRRTDKAYATAIEVGDRKQCTQAWNEFYRSVVDKR